MEDGQIDIHECTKMLLPVSLTLFDLVRYGELKFEYFDQGLGLNKKGKVIQEVFWYDHRPQTLRERHWSALYSFIKEEVVDFFLGVH